MRRLFLLLAAAAALAAPSTSSAATGPSVTAAGGQLTYRAGGPFAATVRAYELTSSDPGVIPPGIVLRDGSSTLTLADSTGLCSLQTPHRIVCTDAPAFTALTLYLDDQADAVQVTGLPGLDTTVWAKGGADQVITGAGDDQLHGGPGDDYLAGRTGTDTADGGTGTDTCLADFVTAC